MPRVFPMIALNSSSVSRRLGIRCVERCDYLNDRAVAIGLQWLDCFRCCLAKTGSPGAQDWPDKSSRVFERKSEMVAHLQEFSKSGRSLDTIPTCLPEGTIPIIKSLRQTFGATTRARRITIAIS